MSKGETQESIMSWWLKCHYAGLKRCQRKKDVNEKKTLKKIKIFERKEHAKQKKDTKEKKMAWTAFFHSLLWLIGSIYDLEAGSHYAGLKNKAMATHTIPINRLSKVLTFQHVCYAFLDKN